MAASGARSASDRSLDAPRPDMFDCPARMNTSGSAGPRPAAEIAAGALAMNTANTSSCPEAFIIMLPASSSLMLMQRLARTYKLGKNVLEVAKGFPEKTVSAITFIRLAAA
jgi:hypothetical protein